MTDKKKAKTILNAALKNAPNARNRRVLKSAIEGLVDHHTPSPQMKPDCIRGCAIGCIICASAGIGGCLPCCVIGCVGGLT